MDVNETQEVKQSARREHAAEELVADLSLDKDVLQSVIRKKLTQLVERRAKVRRLI
jgi:hypothetical protein